MKPFLKWAGGKRQIINHIKPYIDKCLEEDSTYYEPFVGGGFVFITLKRDNCVINDLNKDLMNCYKVIKTSPKLLIEKLREHEEKHYNNENYYYDIRKLDRDEKQYKLLTLIEKAARTIYLNKTCYNGLYRVNSKGYFNTPKGKYKKPNIVDENNILEISEYLNENKVIIKNTTFQEAVKDAKNGDFIYFDPPYDYEETGFTKYNKEGFSFADLEDLKSTCDNLIRKGCEVLISNNATERVKRLFTSENYEIIELHYKQKTIDVQRYISAKSKDRKVVQEVLIHGYKKDNISTSELNK